MMQDPQVDETEHDRWYGRDRATELDHVPKELKAIAEKLEKPNEFLDDFMDASWRCWDISEGLMGAITQLMALDTRIREGLEDLMVKKVFDHLAYGFECYEVCDPPNDLYERGEQDFFGITEAVDLECDRVENLGEYISDMITNKLIPEL